MPLAQQPSQQHHHHLFSAIGTFLHARQLSSHPNPHDPTSDIAPISASLPSDVASDLPHLYQSFESHVAQRLSSLLPAEDSPSLSLASLIQFMGLLLETQTDLRALIRPHHSQTKSMEEFLERSIKLLDVCRDIKEQMAEVESLQGMLQSVIVCLSSEKVDLMSQGQVRRARKALTVLFLHMEVEREDETVHVHLHRSFRGRIRERLSGNGSRDSSPQRWRSWHGNHVSASSSWHRTSAPVHGNHTSAPLWHGNLNTHAAAGAIAHTGGNPGVHASEVFKALHALELNLSPPKLPAKDEEECFCAAIYTLNVLSVFSLNTITAALPSFGKTHSAGFIHPPHSIAWASPFLHLQEKVQEELRGRGKTHGSYAGMWELDQIFCLVKRLLEFTSLDKFPGSDDNKEEVKKLVQLFCRHMQELKRDMGALHAQINEFHNRIVTARMGVLDLLSNTND